MKKFFLYFLILVLLVMFFLFVNIDKKKKVVEVAVEKNIWKSVKSMSIPRAAFSSAVVDDKIYVISGYRLFKDKPEEQYTVNEVYNPESNSWSILENIISPRSGAGAATVDNKIYVIGGLDLDKNILALNEMYDSTANSWKRKEPMPTPRAAPAVVEVGGKIYVIGGGGVDGINFFNTTGANEMYDPKIDDWETKKSLPTPRWRPVAGVVDDKIYVIGGWGEKGIVGINERYDPETDTWEKMASMPTPRTATFAAVVYNKIYVIGGYDIEDKFGMKKIFYAVNERYDPETDTWEKMASMPFTRAAIGGGVVDGKIYVIGGAKKSSDFLEYLSINQVYIP